MDFSKILEYQRKDAETIKLERQLTENKHRKIYTQMISIVKEMQNKSNKLEQEASDLFFEYNKLNKTYKDNLDSSEKFIRKNSDPLNEKELDSLIDISAQITSNLNILEKKLLAQAEQVNKILIEFENSKKQYINAKNKYTENKQLFDNEAAKIEPQIQNINNELKTLEKFIDSKLLDKYNARRQDKIFPIFVPISDKACGGCRMTLPSNQLETIKKNGYLECENCRRIIYMN